MRQGWLWYERGARLRLELRTLRAPTHGTGFDVVVRTPVVTDEIGKNGGRCKPRLDSLEADMNSEMMRVSRARPCPICSKHDWCLVAEDGSAAICARVEEGSSKRCGDAGWLHRLSDKTTDGCRRPSVMRLSIRPGSDLVIDFAAHCERCQQRLHDRRLEQLARQLGVSVAALGRLHVGWNGKGFTFPMRNAAGQVVGVRVRYANGRKAAEKGSRQGLFIPADLPSEGSLLLCEGPTDTAAALDLGFAAVGRPNCSSGGRMLGELGENRDVVVIGDNDDAGRRGARTVARLLVLQCRSVRIIYPPQGCKDLRDWRRVGATHQKISEMCDGAEPLALRITA